MRLNRPYLLRRLNGKAGSNLALLVFLDYAPTGLFFPVESLFFQGMSKSYDINKKRNYGI